MVVERVGLGCLFLVSGLVAAVAVRTPLLAAPVGVLWAWSAARHVRLIVSLDSDGVTVRNPWRSYFIPWSEVATIEAITTESKTPYLVPGVRRRGHAYAVRLWALATPTERLIFNSGEDRRRRDLARLLEEWRQRYGVCLGEESDV